MSSNIAYSTSSSDSSRENSPPKYACFPSDLAHNVFPSLVSPYRHRDLRLPVLKLATRLQILNSAPEPRLLASGLHPRSRGETPGASQDEGVGVR